MNQLLWINAPGLEPTHYLVTHMHCNMQHLLMRQYEVNPWWDTEKGGKELIRMRLEEATTPEYKRSPSMSMSPAERFFWRTRLVAQGIKVAQLRIFIPLLCWHRLLIMEDLPRTVTCSHYPMREPPCLTP